MNFPRQKNGANLIKVQPTLNDIPARDLQERIWIIEHGTSDNTDGLLRAKRMLHHIIDVSNGGISREVFWRIRGFLGGADDDETELSIDMLVFFRVPHEGPVSNCKGNPGLVREDLGEELPDGVRTCGRWVPIEPISKPVSEPFFYGGRPNISPDDMGVNGVVCSGVAACHASQLLRLLHSASVDVYIP